MEDVVVEQEEEEVWEELAEEVECLTREEQREQCIATALALLFRLKDFKVIDTWEM